MTSLNLITSLQAQSPNTVTLGLGLQLMILRGDTIQSIAVCFFFI